MKNTAQVVRVWAAVGVSVLLAVTVLGAFNALTSPLYNDSYSGLDVYNVSGAQTWLAWAVVLLVADGILAGFTIFRMYRPVEKPEASSLPPRPYNPGK